VKGHWTPTGAEPMEEWMDEWIIYTIAVSQLGLSPILSRPAMGDM